MPRGRPRRPALTSGRVLDAALEIVDAEGLDALTMRRLGRELGIEAASLYHHVPGREALLSGMAARMRERVAWPDPLPADWAAAIEAAMVAYAELLIAHPNWLPLVGRHADAGQRAQQLQELLAASIDPAEAATLWHAVRALTVGYALLASTAPGGAAEPPAPGESHEPVEPGEEWLPDYRRSLRLILGGYARTAPAAPLES